MPASSCEIRSTRFLAATIHYRRFFQQSWRLVTHSMPMTLVREAGRTPGIHPEPTVITVQSRRRVATRSGCRVPFHILCRGGKSTGLQNGGRSLHQYNGSKSRNATTFNHIFELSPPVMVKAWAVVRRDMLGSTLPTVFLKCIPTVAHACYR